MKHWYKKGSVCLIAQKFKAELTRIVYFWISHSWVIIYIKSFKILQSRDYKNLHLSVSCNEILIEFWSAATCNISNCCIVLRYPTLESVWRTCLRDIRILHTSRTKTLVHSCCRMSSGTGRSWSEQTVICEWRSKQMNHRSSKYCKIAR